MRGLKLPHPSRETLRSKLTLPRRKLVVTTNHRRPLRKSWQLRPLSRLLKSLQSSSIGSKTRLFTKPKSWLITARALMPLRRTDNSSIASWMRSELSKIWSIKANGSSASAKKRRESSKLPLNAASTCSSKSAKKSWKSRSRRIRTGLSSA